VAAPERTIGSLDILEPAERHRLLREFNDTARPLDNVSLPELFSAQAARTPDATAITFEDRTLSYAALEAHANQLAHHLRTLGVGPETVVGLCVERSPEMVIGLLGILKAGGAYLPLDPAYPAERLAFMLNDAAVPVLLTQQSLRERIADPLTAAHARIVCLDADWSTIARQPTTPPALNLNPRHPAYVIYTSGSTGTPKGVVVEHGALTNKLQGLVREFEVGQNFRSALFISCSFDASIEQAVLPLVAGGGVVLISDETRASPPEFWAELERRHVSFLSCVPSYLESVIHHAPDGVKLDHVALGGEPF